MRPPSRRVRPSFQHVADLLDNGVATLLYVGTLDYMCVLSPSSSSLPCALDKTDPAILPLPLSFLPLPPPRPPSPALRTAATGSVTPIGRVTSTGCTATSSARSPCALGTPRRSSPGRATRRSERASFARSRTLRSQASTMRDTLCVSLSSLLRVGVEGVLRASRGRRSSPSPKGNDGAAEP